MKYIKFGKWYNEYGGFEIHDYFSLMVNQFPIFVIRKYKNNHSEYEYGFSLSIGIFGFTVIKRFIK